MVVIVNLFIYMYNEHKMYCVGLSLLKTHTKVTKLNCSSYNSWY